MSSAAIQKILHEVAVLAIGRGASAAELTYLESLAGASGDYQPLIALVNDFMGQLAQANGTASTVKAVAMNGLGLKLADADANNLAAAIDAGQLSWADGFIACIVMTDATYGKTLDNRAEAAYSLLDKLTSAGKTDLFAGASVSSAVTNLIQAIGASSTSLTNGEAGFDSLVANLSSAGIKSSVVDGYVKGATVFVDSNNNGTFDAGEFTTTTDASGNFTLPANTPAGKLIASGGTDLMTGKAFLGVLTAPAGSTVVNPITTLVEALVAQGQTISAATTTIQTALGLPTDVNPLSYDPIAVLSSTSASAASKATALAVQATALQIANVITQAGAAIDAAGSNTQLSAGTAVINALASAISSGSAIDLNSTATLTGIMQTAATAAGASTLTTTQVGQLAQITAASNTAADNATTITELAKVATVAQGSATSAITTAVSSGSGLGSTVTAFTGSGLTSAVSTATPGTIPGVTTPDTTVNSSGVAITSSAGADNTYKAGNVVSVTVTFSGAVTVTGSPTLTLNVGGVGKTATYASGSGTTSLVFNWTVDTISTDANGISIDANTLSLNSGTINNSAGTAATLTFSAVTDAAAHKIDTTAPASLAAITLDLADASDSGTSTTDNLTNAVTPIITVSSLAGVAMTAGDIVQIIDTSNSNAVVGSYTVLAADLTAGVWNGTTKAITLSTQAAGAHAFKVQLTDAAGNTGTVSTTATTVTVDTTAPASLAAITLDLADASDSGVSTTDNLTNAVTPIITVSSLAGVAMTAGEIIQIIDTSNSNAVVGSYTVLSTDLTGGVWNGSTKAITLSTQAAGAHALKVQLVDAAGNIGTASTAATTVTVDTTAPTATVTSAAYAASTDTLTITSTNFNTLLESGETAATDIKARLDWTKLVWDINGDNTTTTDVSFAVGDISSAKVTDGTTLTVVLATAKGTALEGATGYGDTGGVDTLDVTAGFAKDTAGNVATTDVKANAAITLAAATFTVTEAAAAVTAFGGTATGDITLTSWTGGVNTGTITFTRGGVSTTTAANVTAGITLGTETLVASAANLAGVTVAGAGGTVKLTDTSLAATTLTTLDAAIAGTFNASSVTTTTGTAADVKTTLASAGITKAANVAVTISDANATNILATDLSTIGGATSGVVTVTNAVSISGTIADVMAALVTTETKVIAASANVTVTDLGANQVDLSTITASGTKLAIVAASAELHGSTGLGNFTTMVADDQALTLTIAQAAGKNIVTSGTGANNGAVVLTGTATGAILLSTVQTNITFNTNAVSIAEAGSIVVNAASVTGDTLAITGVTGGITETLQVKGTTGADSIALGAFTTTDAAVVVTGLGDVDTITLSNTAAEHVAYESSADGGATGDVINSFAVANDLLLFKEIDFGGTGVSLATAGSKSVAVNGASGGAADLAALGANFNGVIRISDNAAGDWSNVATVAAAAITGSNNGINVILLIDNGTNTRAYFWNDGATTSDSVVETGELTLIGTLVAVNDATTVNTALF